DINPFVSNIIMFKFCVFIIEYVCSITGAVIFTFFPGNLSICF
ncbi:Macrolide export ATP-binding/permease protein MacB, partial [Trichinella spiralis]